MADSEFTSGPLRDLSAHELGVSGFSDFELLSDSGHNYVYRAMLDGKWVVLKVAKEEEGNTSRNRLLLQREYDIMHAIDCLYVVKTWQMTEVPDLGTAIVMEYVAGRSLERFLEEKPSLSTRQRVADEVMEALMFLHERQVVHGDLNSNNILVTDAGDHVQLIDFGFADTDAYIAKNIGTSPSIAEAVPEENGHLSVGKDIYALGKILELLFPKKLRLVIRRCCSEKNRYSSVREVRAACRRYWRMRWLVPFITLIGIIAAFIVTLWPHLVEPVPQTVVQTDTVVVITQPSVDSTWLNLKKRANIQYQKIYRLYADSISNMPEKNLMEALNMNNRYVARMMAEGDKWMKSYPQYEEQLHSLYMLTYMRDESRLAEIFRDYPIIDYNLNSEKEVMEIQHE